MALTAVAEACALLGRRSSVRAATAGALALRGDDPEVLVGVAQARAMLAVVNNDRAGALRELDVAMAVARRVPALGGTWPFPGLWALLQAVDGNAAAVDEIEQPSFTAYPVVRLLTGYGRAVVVGRSGDHTRVQQALDTTAETAAHFPWWTHLAQRFAGEAAVADGWGDPATWLGEAGAWFEGAGFNRLSSACRALLRQAGAPVRRRGRGATPVPDALANLGVTSREMDVLALLVEGSTTGEIAQRLYLSPRTVQNHIDRLLQRTSLDSRVRLVAFATPLLADPAS